MTALVLLGLLFGFYAAWHGSRAAYALIASSASSSALILAGVPFDMVLWMLIDIAVIAAIEGGTQSTRERLLVVSLVACWPLYQLYENGVAGSREAIALIVAAQFLLTVPWDRLGEHFWTESTA